MKKFYPHELIEVIEGKVLTWDGEKSVEYFIEQPEAPMANCLYFLFEGIDDEDALIEVLINAEASGVIVRNSEEFHLKKWKNANIGVIAVNSISESYLAVAKLYRSQFKIPFVEVIGSSGKTTTKEMIGAVLNTKMPTLVGYNNYNAPSGVAYNIFALSEKHQAAVLEAGMKGPGIMRLSSDMIAPHIAVLTSIQRAHYVSLGSMENIIEAKAEILECIHPKGVLIINGEDENCLRFPLHRFQGKVLTVGFTEKNDLWASDIQYKDFKTFFTVNGKGKKIRCTLHTVGKYNITNALAAILVGFELGLTADEIKRGLANFEPVSGRLKFHTGPQNTILINDNFNANPDSTKQLLQEAPTLANKKPLILVLGDMERPDDDIKDYAKKVHYSIGEEIAKIPFTQLIAIGKWASEYVKGAKNKGVSEKKMTYFETVEEAESYFIKNIIPGSVIIFKASVYVPVRHLIRALGVDYSS